MESQGTYSNKMSSVQDPVERFQRLKDEIDSFKKIAPNECAKLFIKEFVWVLGEMKYHKKGADDVGYVTKSYLNMISKEFEVKESAVSPTVTKEKSTTKVITSPKRKDDNLSPEESTANVIAEVPARNPNLDAKNHWYDQTYNKYKKQIDPIVTNSNIPNAIVFELRDFQSLNFGDKVGMIQKAGKDSHRWDTCPHQACIYFLKQAFKKMQVKPSYKVPKIDPNNPQIKVVFTQNNVDVSSRFEKDPAGMEEDEHTENGDDKFAKNDEDGDKDEEEEDPVDNIMKKKQSLMSAPLSNAIIN